MRARMLVLALLLGWASTASGKALGLLWDFDRDYQPAPEHFLLSVTQSGVEPQQFKVPWSDLSACLALDPASREAFCTLLACPAPGTVAAFWVQGVWPDQTGPVEAEEILTCWFPLSPKGCPCRPLKEGTPRRPPPPTITPPAELPPLQTTPPPRTQQTAEGLNLLPVGEMPPTPTAPPIPTSGGATHHQGKDPMRTTLLSLLVTGLLLSGCTRPWHAEADTYYVAPNGSDSNPCAQAHPCQTIAKGASMLKPGDTLYLRGGTYSDNIGYPTTHPFPSGTSWDQPITIAAAPGETPILRAPGKGITFLKGEHYITVDGITVQQSGFFVNCDVHHIRLQNSILDLQSPGGPHQNIVSGCGRFIEVLNTEIKNSNGYGIYWFGQDSLFDGVDVHHNCGYGVHIYHDPQPGPEPNDVHRNTLRNSTIHDNDTGGETGCSDSGTDFGGTVVTAGTGNKVYNNVFTNNFGGLTIGSRCQECEAYNNTIRNNRGYAMEVGNASARVHDNVVDGSGTGGADLSKRIGGPLQPPPRPSRPAPKQLRPITIVP
jgi:hypothetical protein